MDHPWVKIESWHIAVIEPATEEGKPFEVHTVCGLIPGSDHVVTLTNHRPGNEATCENCYRLVDQEANSF